jgi:hypothetical protein
MEQAVKGLREGARKANKDPSKVSAIVLTYPNVTESASSSSGQRLPMSGTIDQIGSDIERIKAMDGVGHIVFGYAFSPTGRDVKKMVELTKQLARFAR